MNPTKPASAALRAAGLAARVAMAAALAPAARASDATALEYKVKAGYLFNFAKFVEWPAAAFPAAQSPFVIGVLDDGEAAPVIQSLLQGKLIEGRPVKVVAVNAGRIGPGCHILLVTRAAGKTAEEVRDALGATATLVVGETEHFAERGGAIGFTVEEESIRLSLNLERAAEAGLKVSAKLASVARVVKPKRGT